MQRDQLIEMLEPTIESLGYELFDLDLQLDGGGGLVRLYIDNLDPEAGVGLADCETVSRQVSALLDVEDPIPGEYNLEVSTPGLDRRLVKAQHFERFAGSRVKVKLKRLYEERRNFKAKLMGCENDHVLLKEGEAEFSIPLQEIDTARLVPDL